MELREEERAAIEALYLELFGPLFVYARAALETDGAALEAVQETFRTAFARPAALLSSPDPKRWLLVTLKYVVQNEKRSRAALSRLLLTDYDYARGNIPAPDGASTFAYAFLGEADYTFLAHFAFEGRPLSEAAEETHCSVADAQRRFRRAKGRLLTRTDPEKFLRG